MFCLARGNKPSNNLVNPPGLLPSPETVIQAIIIPALDNLIAIPLVIPARPPLISLRLLENIIDKAMYMLLYARIPAEHKLLINSL
jgi:hypothetical protein